MDVTQFELSLFGAGLGLGLLVTLFVWANSLRARSRSRKETEELKTHLQTHMSIHAKGYEDLKQEIEKLKKDNENLRITVATLSNKPGRAELKLLHTWETALKILTLRSPGFATAWETAINEAKQEIEETESGMRALVRKVFSMRPLEDGTASLSQNRGDSL